jgi:heterodisulfide reductase subunit C
MTASERLVVGPDLAAELHELGDFDAEACMNCGVCTATCPLGIDLLPRRVLRDAVLGLDDRVRAAGEAVFSCLLCRACEAACPAGVHISEDVRLLRRWLLKERRGAR